MSILTLRDTAVAAGTVARRCTVRRDGQLVRYCADPVMMGARLAELQEYLEWK